MAALYLTLHYTLERFQLELNKKGGSMYRRHYIFNPLLRKEFEISWGLIYRYNMFNTKGFNIFAAIYRTLVHNIALYFGLWFNFFGVINSRPQLLTCIRKKKKRKKKKKKKRLFLSSTAGICFLSDKYSRRGPHRSPEE